MKISGNEIRPGNIIEYQGKLWTAVKTEHTQPGKGGAYMQVELKCLTDGTKLNERVRSAESVERVHLDQIPFQYLYADGDDLVFMDQTNFDQINVSKKFVGDAAAYLQDNMIVELCMHEGTPISARLQRQILLLKVKQLLHRLSLQCSRMVFVLWCRLILNRALELLCAQLMEHM